MTFTALALQMEHELKDPIHDSQLTLRHLHNPFYSETMTRDRFLHILCYLHFADNSQRPDEGKNYDPLWKLRTVFDKLNNAYAKFYNPLEHVTVDEVTNIQGQGYIQAVHSKEKKKLQNQNLQTYDESGYTYDNMIAKHATDRHLTCRIEGLGHKIFMDNFRSSPRLFDDSDGCKINSCRTVQPNRKDIPHDFEPKRLKLRRGDIRVRNRGVLTALVWKDRREVYMLTKMDPPPAEGNFFDSNCPVKPHIMERYNQHMGYLDNSDRKADGYSMSRHTFK